MDRVGRFTMHPIKEYFVIGDLHTAALVSSNGSIDWLCLPYFDSPSIFAKILDDKIGGSFSITAEGFAAAARYVPDTPIVETTFEKDDAAFLVRDFMLPRPTEEVVPHYLVRTIVGKKGSATVKLTFDPRPNYAQHRTMFRMQNGQYSLPIDDRTLWLHLPKNDGTTTKVTRTGIDITVNIKEGQTKQIIVEYSVASRIALLDRDLEQETRSFWKGWLAQGTFFDYNRDYLIRSAITLKLMQFYPTGGIIAAPTTSLPEEIGGVRNWDYRFVWMRDATFTLYALFVLGYTDEARKFFRFIEMIADHAKRFDGDDYDLDLGLMYTIWGQPLQGEHTLAHLSGYAGSQPVRVGNGAADQFQLDMYGSVIDAYYFMSKRGLPISEDGRGVVRMLVRGIAANWQRKDSGIWEVRGGDQDFTYSKVMAWMGVERALRLADQLQLTDAEKASWTTLKEEIEKWIWDHCWDSERKTFKQHAGTEAQDATNFMFVLLNFISRHDERAKKMIAETQRELTKEELYVYRYLVDDGLSGGEGAFIFCMFWQIAALAAVGRGHEAEKLLKRVEGFMPVSGLLAEEVDPKTGDYLGNHPQAFSHIGYILSAYYIHRYMDKSPQPGEALTEPTKKQA